MARRKKTYVKKVVRKVNAKCFFCESDTSPDYKEHSILRRYMTERGKILGSSRTGLCSKHQKALRRGILRARFLALVPYAESLHTK